MSLWLHGKEDFISEAGAMNVFIIKQAPDGCESSRVKPECLSIDPGLVLEFITMSLDNGIVLPGLTRQSLITLLTEHASGTREFPLPGMPRNVRVVQRDISMGEIIESIADGTLKGYVHRSATFGQTSELMVRVGCLDAAQVSSSSR